MKSDLAEQPQDGNHPPEHGDGLRQYRASEAPRQTSFKGGQSRIKALGRNVLAMLGGLAHGVGDSVGVFRIDARVGQRAGDGVRIEHGVLQSA